MRGAHVAVLGGLLVLACVMPPSPPTLQAMAAAPAKTQETPFHVKLPQMATGNTAFRRVLMTGRHAQVVVMSLQPGQNIGMETHPEADQSVLVEAGTVAATIGGKTLQLGPGELVVVTAGSPHDFKATAKPAKLVVIYSPPLHPANEVQMHKPQEETER